MPSIMHPPKVLLDPTTTTTLLEPMPTFDGRIPRMFLDTIPKVIQCPVDVQHCRTFINSPHINCSIERHLWYWGKTVINCGWKLSHCVTFNPTKKSFWITVEIGKRHGINMCQLIGPNDRWHHEIPIINRRHPTCNNYNNNGSSGTLHRRPPRPMHRWNRGGPSRNKPSYRTLPTYKRHATSNGATTN